jgi:serine/threonine protein kinase
VKTAEPTAPEEFGPYLVYERLGVGGMATVHRAKKRGIAGFERGVALKRMLPHLADDAEFIHSFVREAKLASLLVHPNIAQIYDFGRVGSVYYIAMEHVDGFDVRKMLRYSNRHKDPLPLSVVLSILCELCDALEHAHTFVDEHGTPQGIVHRDVSPSNLIVAHSGHLKVIDFGIAKANARQLHTESGRVKGKLGYMSPEAVSGRAFGPMSDVFSAGVVAHELLTAHPLFSARTDYDTLIRIHEAEILPPSRRNPGVPAALDEIVLAALSRDPDRRLQSAGAFRQGLDYVAEQAGIRCSARDVTEWRARIATSDDPWGSRSSLPAPAAASRSFSFPESRNSSSLPGLNQRAPSELPGTRPMAEPRASRSLGAVDPTASTTPPAPSAPARPGSDDERAVADLTWGSDVGTAGPPHPLVDPDAAPAAPPPPGPEFAAPIGASIAAAAAPRGLSLARLALVLLGSVAAVLAVYQFALRPRKPAAPPPPVVTAIRFVVQPPDAVVEVGGKQAGRQSPFEAPLGPGVYSIRVRKDGYRPWTKEVTLREGDRPTIQVALDPGTALLSVSSQPPGLGVQLDGKPLDQVTPLELQVAAGPHALVVTSAAGITWSQNFTAEVDGKYSYVAPLTATRRTGAAAVAAVARPAPPAAPERAERAEHVERTERAEHVDRIDRGDRNDRIGGKRPGAAPARVAGKEPAEPEIRAPEPMAEPPPTRPEPVAPPPPAAPPEAHPRPAAPPAPPKATPLVAPNAVTKLAGEIPAMRVTGVTESSADVVAKMCIDDHGRVSSVKIIRALPEIADELQRSLSSWRYKPYSNAAGQASPACFPMTLRVVFKRD